MVRPIGTFQRTIVDEMLKQGGMEDEPFQQQAYSIITKTNCSDNAFFGGRNVNIQYEVFSSVDGIVQACVYLVKTIVRFISDSTSIYFKI